MNKIEFKEGIPYAEDGVPVPQVSFSGGRVTADIASHGGLTHIRYFGEQPLGSIEFLTGDPISSWVDLFRLFIKIDGKDYIAEFHETSFFPFGYESFCEFEGVKFRHDMILLNNELTIQAEVIGDTAGKDIAFSWYVTECAVRKGGTPNREWSNFEIDDELKALRWKVTDHQPKKRVETAFSEKNLFGYMPPEYSETHFAVFAEPKPAIRQTPHNFKKSYITASGNSALFVLRFATNDEAIIEFDATHTSSERARTRNEYFEQLKRQPKVSCGDTCVESFIANAAPIAESLQIPDIPGGYRAADSGYWIWGWDSLVHIDSLLWSGSVDAVTDMLHFYRNTAHPEFGIFHSMSPTGEPMLAMVPAAQTLFVVAVYRHYCFSKDKSIVEEFYSFAKKIIDRAMADEVNDSGLIGGVALYPDFPEDFDQTGNDISSFNNGIMYQGLRSIAVCAEILEKSEDAKRYTAMAEKLKKAFNTYMYDSSAGYYYDSIDSINMSPRKYYPIYAVLYTSPFAMDLVRENLPNIAKFMKKKFTQVKRGLTLVPRDEPGFMHDGNQMGMYMPVAERFYRHVMYETGNYEEAIGFIELMKWAWKQISVPESLACAAVNNDYCTLDNPGRKQWFAVKVWHTMTIELGLGIQVDHKQVYQRKKVLDDAKLTNTDLLTNLNL